MIKTVFFDLDWCILNTEPIYKMFDPVMELIESADVSEEVKNKYRKSMRGITDFGRTDDLPQDVREKIIEIYETPEIPDDIETYGDENCILELGTTNFLITTGLRKFQQSKIDKLGIEGMFEAVYIDEVGVGIRYRGKESIFREIIEKYSLLPHEILVVGDKGSSELLAGRNIGAKTAQTLRPKIEKWEGADYYIESLCEIKNIL